LLRGGEDRVHPVLEALSAPDANDNRHVSCCTCAAVAARSWPGRWRAAPLAEGRPAAVASAKRRYGAARWASAAQDMTGEDRHRDKKDDQHGSAEADL